MWNSTAVRPVLPRTLGEDGDACTGLGSRRHSAFPNMFYIKTRDLDERSRLQSFLKERGIASAFHYIPLHSAPEGLKAGRFVGEDVYTTTAFERLLRLPMYYRIGRENIRTVVEAIKEFYK